MALLEPELAILDETDSGLDIDALKTVAAGVNAAKNDENGIILITHYQARAPAPRPARPSAPCAPAHPPMQPAICAPATRGSGCSTSSSASPAPTPNLTPHP